MEKLINQLSDEQLMMLLSLVEDHQISRAIDYLRKYTQFRLDQAKAIVIYCVEQRQRALYHYKKNPSYIPKLTTTRHVRLEEKYHFDDAFIRDLQFPAVTNESSAHSLYQIHLAAKRNGKNILILLLAMTIVLSLILLISIH